MAAISLCDLAGEYATAARIVERALALSPNPGEARVSPERVAQEDAAILLPGSVRIN